MRSFSASKIVGELVKVADAANHGGGGDKVIAVGKQVLQQVNVLAVGFDELVMRVVVVGLFHPSVLAEVVEAYDFITGLQKFFDQITADKTGRTSYQHFHERFSPAATATAGCTELRRRSGQ